MALTKKELELLHGIDNKIVLLFERQEKQGDTQSKLKIDVQELKKTVYENGLNSRVKQMFEWMTEERKEKAEGAKQEDQQTHEEKLTGWKTRTEVRIAVINGLISGTLFIASVLLK